MEQSFRTAMFGFDKEDVAKFIYQQNKNYEKKLAKKDTELERLREALAKVEGQSEEASGNEALKQEVLRLTDELQIKVQALLYAMAQERTCLDQAESDYNAMQERCRETELLREKAEKFDSLASVISSIVGAAPESEKAPAEETAQPKEESLQNVRRQLEEKQSVANELDAHCQSITEALRKLKF